MEDFYYAGGLRALLASHRRSARRSARAPSNGSTLGENIAGAEVFNDDVILPRDKPLVANDSLAVLRGNLAPDGAVIKPAAAEARLLRHTGPAVVFADYNDMAARIDDPALAGRRGLGARAASTRARWARRACPSGASCRSRRSCSQQGVRDMLRISDARMSGTSYGACVLHVAPESLRRRPARAGRATAT